LERRGFDPDELQAYWDLGGIGLESLDYAWRLFIPIKNRQHQNVSWTTRTILDVTPAYRSAPRGRGLPIKQCLYGVEYCTQAVLVCEGPADVWRVGPGAVALLGVPPSRWQLLEIVQFEERYLCLDNDPAGKRACQQLLSWLAPCRGKTIVIELEDCKDPAEAPESEIRELRKFIGTRLLK